MYSFDGPKGWGKNVAKYLPNCKLFRRAEEVPDGATVYVRLDQQGKWRDITRGLIFDLTARGCVTVPNKREAIWYDDKIAQLPDLKPWAPATHYLTAPPDPFVFNYPLISKAAEGASAANVRLIHTPKQATKEIEQVFSPKGLQLKYGRSQRDYLLWQEFLPGNIGDYRICIVGDCFFGLMRYNRPGTWAASGSGIGYPITLATERERAAARLANEAASALGTRLVAFDVLFTPAGEPRIVEMSASWNIKGYKKSPLFDRRTLRPTNQPDSIFQLVSNIVLAAHNSRTGL